MSRTVFDERDQLRREYDRLSDQCRYLSDKVADLELARKVADAAVAMEICRNAYSLVSDLPRDERLGAVDILNTAEYTAIDAFDAAVREYRARVEGVGATDAG